jgi:GTP-binding protein HflX
MGLGAYEVDVYSDAIKLQIQTIQKKLERIREKRVLHRERRDELGFSGISLAGYTTAGKTSLFNALTAETLRVGNKGLFTTLSTTTRLVEFSGREFLLTDTVGFIDRLPLMLIEAFHSTLEETIFADVIILVIDFSEPVETIDKKNNICLETINRIGATGIPVITALNKIDLLTKTEQGEKLEALRDRLKNPVLISALKETNLDELKQETLKNFETLVQAEFTVPITDKSMQFLSWVHNGSNVKKTDYIEGNVRVIFEADPSFVENVRKKVEGMNGKLETYPSIRTAQH